MQGNTISIIVPIYKVEQYLRKCLDSILVQTYKNIEIILVDDGSPDNCGLICDEYQGRDTRIRVIHQENGGLSTALNSGLDIATGDYIGFIDSDDWIEPNMYEHLATVMNERGSDIVQCKYHVHDNAVLRGKKTADELEVFTLTDFNTMIEAWIDGKIRQSKFINLYKTTVFNDLRFPVGYMRQDAIAFPQILAKCGTFTKTNRKLYHYNIRDDSITTRTKQIGHIESREKVISALLEVRKNNIQLKKPVAFFICRILVREKHYYSLADSKKITTEMLSNHMKTISKVFRACFKDARNDIRYVRLSKKKHLFWWLFYFSPSLALRFMKIIINK